MRKLRSSLVRPHGLVVMPRIYAGHIGPIRREIIFEPLPQTLPAEPVPAPPAPVPETQPEEPVPTPA
jgi:hypothetical protein